jgi:hypothetical protein
MAATNARNILVCNNGFFQNPYIQKKDNDDGPHELYYSTPIAANALERPCAIHANSSWIGYRSWKRSLGNRKEIGFLDTGQDKRHRMVFARNCPADF